MRRYLSREALGCAFLLVALSGCRKEDKSAPIAGGSPWMSHIAVAVDSAFIMAPNVVTPNSDGINDAFMVVLRNLTTVQTTVLFLDGATAFSSTALHPIWDGLDSTDLGRYRVFITATSTSGIHLSANSYLDLIDYGTSNCLSFGGVPVTADQFDERIFNVSYPTQDIFCP